jgi:hypothetical protein
MASRDVVRSHCDHPDPSSCSSSTPQALLYFFSPNWIRISLGSKALLRPKSLNLAIIWLSDFQCFHISFNLNI